MRHVFDGFYQDDCGTCWMPYCYNYTTHNILYDLEESECNTPTSMGYPGSNEDPYFNSYCDGNCRWLPLQMNAIVAGTVFVILFLT